MGVLGQVLEAAHDHDPDGGEQRRRGQVGERAHAELVGGGLADLGLLVGVPDGLEGLRDGPFVEELLRPGDERDVAEDVG